MVIGKDNYYLFNSVFFPPRLVRDDTRMACLWKEGLAFYTKRIGLDRKRILNVAAVVHEQRKKIRRK